MNKAYFEKRMARLIAKRDAMKQTALNSQDVNEVRNINAQIEEINADIDECREAIAQCEAEEQRAAQDAQRSAQPPADAKRVNGDVAVMAGFTAPATASQKREDADPFATMEYREAFKAYAQRDEKTVSRPFERARAQR